jgi:hypothetical protein
MGIGENRNTYKFWWKNQKEALYASGRTILKWILEG